MEATIRELVKGYPETAENAIEEAKEFIAESKRYLKESGLL